MTSGWVSGMSLCEHKGLSNDTKNKFNNHHIGREKANISCLAGMRVHKMERAIGASWYNYPIVLLMEISKDGSILLVGVQVCGTVPRGLTHTHKYIIFYTYISSSLKLLLKFIYVTGWLDPKSCVHTFINKNFTYACATISLSLHKANAFLG